MKKKLNFATVFVLDGLSILAIIGAVQVGRWACSLTAAALAYWGGWELAEAAQAAPWLLLATVLGLGLSLWIMHDDNEYYKSTGYGKISRSHARNPEYPQDEEKGA